MSNTVANAHDTLVKQLVFALGTLDAEDRPALLVKLITTTQDIHSRVTHDLPARPLHLMS